MRAPRGKLIVTDRLCARLTGAKVAAGIVSLGGVAFSTTRLTRDVQIAGPEKSMIDLDDRDNSAVNSNCSERAHDSCRDTRSAGSFQKLRFFRFDACH